LITLRVSRRTLRGLGCAALAIAAVAGLYFLGSTVTPRDSDARPMILSPSLRSAERYRTRTQDWVAEMTRIDDELTGLLAAQAASGATALYAQSEKMQAIGENAASLVREVAVADVPVAMAGLQEQALETSQAYLDTALSVARWIGAPAENTRRDALEALRSARALRLALEDSRWLATE
jgi:hypothetical protein